MTLESTTNAATVMTDEQKFLFDLKGWLLLPAVLNDAEIEPIKRHLFALRNNPESLPEHERNSYAGPCQELLDHPAIVPILREIIAQDVSEDAYGFRCDSTFVAIREAGWQPSAAEGPHNYDGSFMGPTHHYQFIRGRIFSPSVRVVWELTPVLHGQGGTLLLSGSHKGNYSVPPQHRTIENPLFETYECPAGSVVIFSENVCHASAPWLVQEHPRVAIFNHYMHQGMRFHREPPPHEAIMTMPIKRRTLFRDVWMLHFPGAVPNDYYDQQNRAQGMDD